MGCLSCLCGCCGCCRRCCGRDPNEKEGRFSREEHDRREQAAIVIQRRARGFLVRLWLRRFYKHSRKMSAPWWRLTFASLMFYKTLLLLVSLVAGTNVMMQDKAAIATQGNSDFFTPFQEYPHLFGVVYQILVSSHGITGVLLFLTIFWPVFSAKGGTVHIVFGRIVLFVWLWHLLDGLVNASVVLLSRGYNEERYPTDGFSMWLFIQFAFIANCVIDFLLTGLANLQYKIKIPTGARITVIVSNTITLLHALFLMGLGIYVLALTKITSDARDYSIVFIVEVPIYAVLMVLNITHFITPKLEAKLHYWVTEHQRNMIFCVNLTLITGVANITHKYIPGFTVLFWALQDIIAIVWCWKAGVHMKDRIRSTFWAYNSKPKMGEVVHAVGAGSFIARSMRASGTNNAVIPMSTVGTTRGGPAELAVDRSWTEGSGAGVGVGAGARRRSGDPVYPVTAYGDAPGAVPSGQPGQKRRRSVQANDLSVRDVV